MVTTTELAIICPLKAEMAVWRHNERVTTWSTTTNKTVEMQSNFINYNKYKHYLNM